MLKRKIREFEKKRRIRINFKRLALSLTIFTLLIIVIVRLSIKALARNNEDEKSDSKVEENIDDIESDLDEDKDIDENPKVDKAEELETEEDEKIEEDEKKEKPEEFYKYSEEFKKDLFLGDSISDSLSFYEFLEEGNVLAEFGYTARKAQDDLELIGSINPENIFIMLGMNDILNVQDSKNFIENYGLLIDSIKERLPGVNIYIQSILPVDPEVEEKKPLLTNETINRLNGELIELAESKNVNYVKLHNIIEEDIDLLEPDGIHPKYDFYILWLNYLMENIK